MQEQREHHLDWQTRRIGPQGSVNLDLARVVCRENFDGDFPRRNSTFPRKNLGWNGNWTGPMVNSTVWKMSHFFIFRAQIINFVGIVSFWSLFLYLVIQFEILFHLGNTPVKASVSYIHYPFYGTSLEVSYLV